LFVCGSFVFSVLAIVSARWCLFRWAFGFGGSRWLWLIVGIAGDGRFVSGPLVEVIGRCIVKGFAFLLRGLVTYGGGVFLMRGKAPGPHLIGFLADPLGVPRVFRISSGFSIGRSFR
jgi:hypothetical protein